MMLLFRMMLLLPVVVGTSLMEMTRRLAVDDAIKDACSPFLETYYTCAGIEAETSYTYGDDDMTDADYCAAAASVATMAESCGSGACANAYKDYVSCYVEARCGTTFECVTTPQVNEGSVVATLGFYSTSGDVCFQFGSTTNEAMWVSVVVSQNSKVVFKDLVSNDPTEVYYYKVYDSSCTTALTETTQVANVDSLLSWDINGPSAVRVLDASTGVHALFRNQVVGESCSFSFSTGETVGTTSNQLLVTDIGCSVQGVDVSCGSLSASIPVDPTLVCSDTVLHFVATNINGLALTMFHGSPCPAQTYCLASNNGTTTIDDDSSSSKKSSNKTKSTMMIAIIVVLASVLSLFLIFLTIKCLYRRQRPAEPAADVASTTKDTIRQENEIGGDSAAVGDIEFSSREAEPAAEAPTLPNHDVRRSGRIAFNSLL